MHLDFQLLSSQHKPLVIAAAASALLFGVDLFIPGGYAIGVLYLAALALFLSSRVPWHPIAHAALATALTLADVIIGPAGSDLTQTLVNRGLSVGAIWLSAYLLVRHRRAQLLFERLLDAAPDSLLVAAPSEQILYANVAATTLFGLDRDDLIGRRWATLLTAPCDGQLAQRRALRPDGGERPVECNLSQVRANGGAQSIVVIRDISERLRYEERLRSTQRMEAIGKLARGIAHDFNNMLAIIICNVDFAKSAVPAGSPAHEDLDELRATADRAAELTRQLLAFSRRQVIEPIRVNLNEVVQQTDRMLARLLGEDIEIHHGLLSGVWAIEVDPCQLEQVLLNLAVNARDAMPTGGKLTFETQNVTLDEAYARQHPEVEAGDYVMLGVSDTGSGMPEEVRVRVFEPFFSTKPVGKGTGRARAWACPRSTASSSRRAAISGSTASLGRARPSRSTCRASPARPRRCRCGDRRRDPRVAARRSWSSRTRRRCAGSWCARCTTLATA